MLKFRKLRATYERYSLYLYFHKEKLFAPKFAAKKTSDGFGALYIYISDWLRIDGEGFRHGNSAVLALPSLVSRHIYSDVRGVAFWDGQRREKKYTHGTHADITLTLQPVLSLGAQSALAFRECHSFLLVGSLRFNVCASPFVRALRLVDLPKFIRGRTFERSSVKKFALLRRCDTFLVFFYFSSVLLHCCL